MGVVTEYTLLCQHRWCLRNALTDRVTRCAACQFFAFCDKHYGTSHECQPARSGQGRELPPISDLINCLNTSQGPLTGPYSLVGVALVDRELCITYIAETNPRNRRVQQLVNSSAYGPNIVVEFVQDRYSRASSTTALLTACTTNNVRNESQKGQKI